MSDVIGWELEEARESLRAEGWQVQVQETAPPRGRLQGKLRVVRQKRISEESVELVAAIHPDISSITEQTEPDGHAAPQITVENETAPQSASDIEAALEARIDPARVPKHVAIVMDGNGRWAERQGLPRIMGHRAGHESVKAVVNAAPDLGIQHLTLYTFSAENWRRPAEEVSALMELIPMVLRLELPDLITQGVKVRALGRIEGLPEHVREEFQRSYEATKHNSRLTLNIAVNYSGRWEIIDAARRLAQQVKEGRLQVEDIDEELFSSSLYLPDTPDPELLIRTSGEQRISNYLLWQIAYTEVHVTPVLWPDFRRIHLLEAIIDFQQRQRRFGAINDSSHA